MPHGVLALSLLFLAVTSVISHDSTLMVNTGGQQIVDAALDKLKLSCIFPSNYATLLGKYGKFLTDYGVKFASTAGTCNGGIFQISEAEFLATKGSKYDKYHKLSDKKLTKLKKYTDLVYNDLCTPMYGLMAAALRLQRIAESGEKIPGLKSPAVQYNFLKTKYFDSAQQTQLINSLRPESAYESDLKLIVEDCSIASLDMVFVCDGSGSVGASNFQSMLDMVKKIVAPFPISSTKVRVAFIQYSANTRVEFNFGDYDNLDDVKSAIGKVKYMQGSTNTAAAIQKGRELLENSGRDRIFDGVSKTMVVLTDGKSNDQAATKKQAEAARAVGINIFSVGIGGGADTQELQDIAGDCNRVYVLEGFDETEIFADVMKKDSCKAGILAFVGDYISSGLGPSEVQYLELQVEVKAEDPKIEFGIDVQAGGVDVYASTDIPTPSEAVFDAHVSIGEGESTSLSVDLSASVDVNVAGRRRRRQTTSDDKVSVYLAVKGSPNEFNQFGVKCGSGVLQSSFLLLTLSLLFVLFKM